MAERLPYYPLQMRVQEYRGFLSVVLLMPLLSVACGGPPATVKAWDNEVTGVVAQVNDVIALQFLPASLGMPEGETTTFVDGAEATPDLARVVVACTRLAETAGLYGPLAADPPPEREATAVKVLKLQQTLAAAASACIASAGKGDREAYETDSKAFSTSFTAAGTLMEAIGGELHDGTKCPDRLRATVKTCAAG